MTATVSVVIPVKNRAHLIKRAIDSCMEQTRLPDEIVVADDGSTDDTAGVVERLAADNSRLILVRRPVSGGAAVARNTAAARATGTYIAFLDSDDSWAPTKLEQQLALAEAHPECPGIFGGVLYLYEDRPKRRSMPNPVVTRQDLEITNALGSTSNGMVRRDLFNAVGGFDESLPNCEDWDLWLKLSRFGDLRAVQDYLLHYSFDAGNKLSRDNEKLLRGHDLVFERIMNELDPARPRRFVGAMHELKRAEAHIRVTGDRARAVRAILRGVTRSLSPKVLLRAAHLGSLLAVYGRRS